MAVKLKSMKSKLYYSIFTFLMLRWSCYKLCSHLYIHLYYSSPLLKQSVRLTRIFLIFHLSLFLLVKCIIFVMVGGFSLQAANVDGLNGSSPETYDECRKTTQRHRLRHNTLVFWKGQSALNTKADPEVGQRWGIQFAWLARTLRKTEYESLLTYD